MPIDKSNRKFDFVIHNTKNKKLFLIEVNFYSAGGSKLKATSGEYISLNNFIKNNTNVNNNSHIEFIWITDGQGWNTAKKSLEESYNNGVIILNIDMVKKGILEKILIN